MGCIDARNLQGIAHPVRVRMLAMLRAEGPATATTLARRLGLNTGATSYHLRQLAAHGFIVEDTHSLSSRWRSRWRFALGWRYIAEEMGPGRQAQPVSPCRRTRVRRWERWPAPPTRSPRDEIAKHSPSLVNKIARKTAISTVADSAEKIAEVVMRRVTGEVRSGLRGRSSYSYESFPSSLSRSSRRAARGRRPSGVSASQ